MSEVQQKPSSRWWPKHLAERRWYGWVMAVIWFLIFLMGEIGIFSPQTEAVGTKPDSTASLLFTGLVIAIIFYAIYWFFMMITYYVSEESKKTYKFLFDLFGL
jgi:hypothetical protein